VEEDDDEYAHIREDEMLWEYVRGNAKAGDLVANILLQSYDLGFSRWCA
jgi:hypothetical protein